MGSSAIHLYRIRTHFRSLNRDNSALFSAMALNDLGRLYPPVCKGIGLGICIVIMDGSRKTASRNGCFILNNGYT